MLFQLLYILQAESCVDIDYTSPESWPGLCSSGSQQSPIALSTGTPINHFIFTSYPNLSNIQAENCTASYTVSLTTGNKVYMKDPEELTIICAASAVTFHSPSEHTIDGSSFDLEMQVSHNVLGTSNYAQVVMSVFFNHGTVDNPFFDQIFNGTEILEQLPNFNLSMVIGKNTAFAQYFMYLGSITTPPCTENVLWYVLVQPGEISDAQLAVLQDKWQNNPEFAGGNGNNRPIQTSTGREVFFRG